MASDPPTSLDPRDQRLHAASPVSSWRGHLFRYRLACGFLEPGDLVIDAACGTGYGTALLAARARTIGVDREAPAPEAAAGELVEADLEAWEPDEAFDVFVGFETIEHLPDYDHYVALAKRARRWIVVSAPIVPTTELNPWHLHNFAPGELASLFVDEQWAYFQGIVQPSELSEIYVFARR